jgi:predicted nucleic acid-binding protein
MSPHDRRIVHARPPEPAIGDVSIAAAASVHGLEVLTFTRADFRPMGIACRDPPANPPEDAPD